MFVPLTVILACIIWAGVSCVKWFIIRRNNKKYQIDPKLLAEMLKGTGVKSSEELLKKFRERQKFENDEKIKATLGKDLFEQIQERKNGKVPKKPRVFDPDMLHDSVTRLYAERLKMEEMAKEKKVPSVDKNGNGGAKIRSSKLKTK